MKHALNSIRSAPTLALGVVALLGLIGRELRECRTDADRREVLDDLAEDAQDIGTALGESLHGGTANTTSPALEDLPDGHPLKPVPEPAVLTREEQRAALQKALDDLDDDDMREALEVTEEDANPERNEEKAPS